MFLILQISYLLIEEIFWVFSLKLLVRKNDFVKYLKKKSVRGLFMQSRQSCKVDEFVICKIKIKITYKCFILIEDAFGS